MINTGRQQLRFYYRSVQQSLDIILPVRDIVANAFEEQGVFEGCSRRPFLFPRVCAGKVFLHKFRFVLRATPLLLDTAPGYLACIAVASWLAGLAHAVFCASCVLRVRLALVTNLGVLRWCLVRVCCGLILSYSPSPP